MIHIDKHIHLSLNQGCQFESRLLCGQCSIIIDFPNRFDPQQIFVIQEESAGADFDFSIHDNTSIFFSDIISQTGVKMKNILGPMRLPFVILTPACVLLGLGTAVWSGANVNYLHFAIAMAGAIAAHISVNAFNEYFDFKSGLDGKTTRTAFSGGSGTLPANPGAAKSALATAIIAFCITGAVGAFFVYLRGKGLLPVGIAGMLVVFLYTIWFTKSPFLSLITPGLGFGTFMVMGTHFVLSGSYNATAFVASLVPFFLVNNLLLLNQFPDVEPDKSVGRKNLPILIGNKGSSMIYGAFLLFSYLCIVVGVWAEFLPKWSLLGLLTLALAIPAFRGAVRFSNDIPKLAPAQGQNVIVNIATPVLVAIGMLVGS